MELFCTYCCREKDRRPELFPAIRRYRSPRIREVYNKSRARGGAYAILSGRFGLIGPHRKIPWYDHLLKAQEVPALLPQMVDYMKRKEITKVIFYHVPLNLDPYIKPYLAAITHACHQAKINLELVEMKND